MLGGPVISSRSVGAKTTARRLPTASTARRAMSFTLTCLRVIGVPPAGAIELQGDIERDRPIDRRDLAVDARIGRGGEVRAALPADHLAVEPGARRAGGGEEGDRFKDGRFAAAVRAGDDETARRNLQREMAIAAELFEQQRGEVHSPPE